MARGRVAATPLLHVVLSSCPRTSYTSVLTIVAFSLERYLAICHPLHSYRMSGLRRAVRIIAVLWVVSFIAALPFAVLSTVHYLEWPIGKTQF